MKNDLQQTAANPDYSVWVSASAGTGKTKILTDRVLRLLLNEVEFNKILCITFTNAAANEIQNRIYLQLAKWATSDDRVLGDNLADLLGKFPTNNELQYAKTLYQKLLSTSDKINIYTIHSFCQKILKRFPFESGLNPGFQMLDNMKIYEVISTIKKHIYSSNDNEELINFFASNFHELTLNDILEAVLQHKLKFKKGGINHNIGANTLAPVIRVHEIQRLINQLPNLHCKKLFLAGTGGHFSLNTLSSNEGKNSLTTILPTWNKIKEFFLTKDGQRRERLLPAQVAREQKDLLQQLIELQRLVFEADQEEKIEQMLQYSTLLMELAKIFINLYEIHKLEHSLVDYDDLINLTRQLLTNSGAKDWVLYKLDGGIQHLLVDEAQDTSPDQWEIIAAIIEDFYAGEGAARANRTIFVVGDEKQSIFSFQGANVDSFTSMNKHLREKLSNAKKDFKDINLELSYRSTEEILKIVFLLFEQIKSNNPHLFTADNPRIAPFRKTHPGVVELWPLIKAKKPPKLFWPLPEELGEELTLTRQLAENIANFIKKQIDEKVILPSKGRAAEVADFMILVRKRDKLTVEVINQLKQQGLAVAGIDRMVLNKNLSVLDLISVAKFVLSPHGDLNLAALLKSPIIGMQEKDILLLTKESSKEKTLWKTLKQHHGTVFTSAYQKLCQFQQLYQSSNVGNFFQVIADCLNYRQVLIKENSVESNDAINELLTLSANYSNKINSSLQSFIYWFEENEIEIKRDVDSLANIKVMTVHGAKGLQAPVVILCDTTSIPVNKNKFIWQESNNLLAVMHSSNAPDIYKELKEKERQQELQEHLRLLYVAMTRAEDQLIICGYLGEEKLAEHCWYALISKALQNLGETSPDGGIVYSNRDKNEQFFTSFVAKDLGTPTLFRSNKDGNYQPKNCLRAYEIPLKNTVDKKVSSPLIPRYYLEYGRIFHKILEDSLKNKKISLISTHPLIQTLSPKLQNKIYNSINNLLQNQEFLSLILEDIKTEVNIGELGGQIDNEWINIGRIDLLAVNAAIVTIVDYKSDANPPVARNLVSPGYIEQLNFYRLIIQKIYPHHEIVCKILWLETGTFFNI